MNNTKQHMVLVKHGLLIKMSSLLFVLCLFVASADAQVVALKNNLLYDAVATPNLTLEWKLADRWTMNATVGFNPFPLKDDQWQTSGGQLHKWRHILADVELKYWFCAAFVRDFVGFNIGYTHYNVVGGKYPIGWLYPDILSKRRQGDAVMAGVSYGWSWILSPHWSIELAAGVDGGYTWFEEYDCVYCGTNYGPKRLWFAVPKLDVNLIWQIH